MTMTHPNFYEQLEKATLEAPKNILAMIRNFHVKVIPDAYQQWVSRVISSIPMRINMKVWYFFLFCIERKKKREKSEG